MDVFGPNVGRPEMPRQKVPEQSAPSASLRLPHFVAIIAGVVCALLVSGTGGPAAVWGKTTGAFSAKKTSQASAITSEPELDRQRPQKQAEILLERAVSNSSGSADRAQAQIEARVDTWRGKIKWDAQLGDLTTVALNSNDQSVRVSAVEVQLAAYGLSKNEATVEALVRQADSRDHAQQIWALWGLGLLGNRGLETDRIVKVLTLHVKNSNRDFDTNKNKEDTRGWAVEALALVGTTATISPLLDALHDDPSAMVRERAACSLAESGMLSRKQRRIAVPRLIDFSGDPALDVQTHAWAFQALAAITQQRLPNDSAAWRNWYQESATSGQ
jgi:PBS lyase HEAT-like repeat-containing protein